MSNGQRNHETPAESAAQTDTGPAPEEGIRCPSWRGDPESISKRAAETYVQNDITPPSQARWKKSTASRRSLTVIMAATCISAMALVVRVIVRETDIVVGMGAGADHDRDTAAGDAALFLRLRLPDGQLVLTVIECRAQRAAAPPGPRWLGNGAPRPAQAHRWTLRDGAQRARYAGPAARRGDGRFFSSRFGHDFANVRVHADAAAAESARSVRALAYTVGSDVVFAAVSMRREPAPDSNFWPRAGPPSCNKTGRSASVGPSAPGHGVSTPQ